MKESVLLSKQSISQSFIYLRLQNIRSRTFSRRKYLHNSSVILLKPNL